jgi:hypothetical protein
MQSWHATRHVGWNVGDMYLMHEFFESKFTTGIKSLQNVTVLQMEICDFARF